MTLAHEHLMSQIDPCSEERARLSRRLAAIQDQNIKQALRKYRTRISKPDAIEQRGCGTHFIRLNGNHSHEAKDLISLLHTFLDEQGIAACRN
jgi:hypothetical protein